MVNEGKLIFQRFSSWLLFCFLLLQILLPIMEIVVGVVVLLGICKLRTAFIFLFALGLANGQLPLLPEFYTTKIQGNINLMERGKSEPIGVSFAFDEAVWGDKYANLQFKLDIEDHLNVPGQVIWNPELDGVTEFLHILYMEGVNCWADTLTNNPLLGALFDAGAFSFPSISHMLHFGSEDDYVFDKTETVNGIPCNVYTSDKVLVPAVNGTFKVRYYWTQGDVWVGTSGANKTVPVLAAVHGEYNYLDKWHTADMYFEFSDFKEDFPKLDQFQPPPDIYCVGRKMEQDLKPVPEFYSYTSESLFFREIPNGDGTHQFVWILSTRDEHYDFFQKVSRSDYKTFDLASFIDPQEPNKGSYVNEIKDFKSGVMYQVWKDYGNCSIKWVGNDPIDDVTINDDGTISMTRPFEVFYLDKKFAYNGHAWRERNIDMKSYVTQQTANELVDGSHNWTVAVYVSSGEVNVEGDDRVEFNVPTKIEKYPSNGYMDLKLRQMHNIIGFRSGEPDFRLFDITPCFADFQLSHRMIRTGWDSSFIVNSRLKVIQNNVRGAVMRAAGVSALRVQNIELYEQEEDACIYILFTLVDFPRESIIGVDVSTLPSEVTIALPAAVENLQKVIQNGTLKIELPRKDGSFGAAMAATDFFEEVDRPACNSASPSNNYTISFNIQKGATGYSPGAMAGLAFGMIAMGLVLGGLIYSFLLRSKVRSQMPTVRGFENPLHGTVGLAKTSS